MLVLKASLSVLGIVLTIVGVLVVYINSPFNEHTIDGGNASTDREKLRRGADLKNRRLRNGVVAVVAGTGLQLASSSIDLWIALGDL